MKKITQAFVLGAGLGTRLRPLTDELPKPLVPIFQKPLITFAFDHLLDAEITTLFVNTHHRPEAFREIFGSARQFGAAMSDQEKQSSALTQCGSYRGHAIQFHHEPDLLETGGGIANIVDSLGQEPLLVYNGDILTDLPLAPLLETHLSEGKLVTLALRSGAGPKHIALDERTRSVVDIGNRLGTDAAAEFVFTGVYVVDREFVDRLQPAVKRSVIPAFLDLIRENKQLAGVVIDAGHWWDVGNREAYLQLHREIRELSFPSYPVDNPKWKRPVHETAIVAETAQVRGCSVVGRNCRVGPEAVLEDTILWAGSQIASRSDLRSCIVRSGRKAEGFHRNSDI